MKARLTRSDCTKGMTLLMSAEGGIEVFVNEDGTVVRGFSGRRAKSDFYYSFKNAAEATAYAEKYVADKMKSVVASKPVALNIGDILVCSWGWEQTNIDYYEVVKVSASRVTVREIESERNYNAMSMTGKSVPLPGKFIGEAMSRAVVGESIRINSHSGATLMKPIAEIDGVKVFAPKAYSCYA